MFRVKLFATTTHQISTLLRIIAFFWFVAKIWSYKTWVADRTYPVIPLFDYLDVIPNIIHVGLYVCSLVLLLMILLLPRNKIILLALFIFEFLSCVLDTVRWQPWEYMYLCFILLFIINFKKPKNVLLLIHVFLVSMYLFSGLHKVNRDFLSQVWMNMFLRDYLHLNIETIIKYKLFFVGLLIPFFEILFAILLFFIKKKRSISVLLIGMHISSHPLKL